jgi:hypothetical protein
MRYDEQKNVRRVGPGGSSDSKTLQRPAINTTGQTRCLCLLLQYLLQSCSRGGRGIVEDMCHERRRAEACVD